MPSESNGVAVPGDAAAVAAQYVRVERPLSAALTLVVAGVAAGAVLVLPLLAGLAVALGALAVVRAPILRTEGRAELTTDDPPAAVRADFEGPTPPTLAFQWGVADTVQRTATGGRYEVSYLLGLRSVTMTVETERVDGAADGGDKGEGPVRYEQTVTTGGKPWGTYEIAVHGRDGGAAVTVETESDRRFGLVRVPQWVIAERYRERALEAQGYTVAERSYAVGL